MGNWNRRWLPKKKYKYEDFPTPHHHTQFHSPPAIQGSSVPSWERDFCYASGIPWPKVLTAKKYMHCYDNVVKWDDSAGQEAFEDAKRRYWADINGLPPQTPAPNPDMYIDKVDWNSTIDPELILDLDREYFNPNEGEKSVNSENNLASGCLVWEEDKIVDNDDSPWENGNLHGIKNFDGVRESWNEWDNPVNMKDDDPWEKNCSKIQGTLQDTTWGSHGSESRGWNTGPNNGSGFPCTDNTYNNSWHQGGGESTAGAKRNEWVNNRNCSWSQSHWNGRGQEQWNSDNNSRWNRNPNRGGRTTSKDNRWGESEFMCSGWQQLPRQNNERNADFGRPGRGDKAFYTGSRKREGSSQYMSSYKSSRFQGDEQRTAYNWREEKTPKKVTFSFNE